MRITGETDIPTVLARGTEHELRLGHQAELITGLAGCGDWFEITKQDKMFSSMTLALTIASTHNLGLDNVADTAIVGFANPSSSGVVAIIQESTFTSISGTPPASATPVAYLARGTDTITAATTGTILCTSTGLATSKMRALSNIALAGLNTTSSNNAVMVLGGATFAGAIAANHDMEYRVNVGGRIIVPPGSGLFVLAGSAAGTSWVVSASLMWVETPWPH